MKIEEGKCYCPNGDKLRKSKNPPEICDYCLGYLFSKEEVKDETT